MTQITLKNVAGKDAGKVDLDDEMFGIQPNVPVMHQVVTAQLANRRAGTQNTKTRGEVRGGGAKPFRQKGTGNARQGSTNSPQHSGGGVALGPKPRSYAQRTPKKMIRLALRSALSDRAAEGKVVVVDDWAFDAPKTRDATSALAALGLDGRVLLVVDRDDAATALSFRNLPEIQLIRPGELNAYDVLCNDWIVFTSANLPVSTPADSKKSSTGTAAEAKPSSEASPLSPSDTTIQSFAAAVQDERFGAGSHVALEDGTQPAGFNVKGNADSMLYHVPGSAFYDRTIAEVWFDTTEAAEAAGFSLPPSQQAQAEQGDGETESSSASTEQRDNES